MDIEFAHKVKMEWETEQMRKVLVNTKDSVQTVPLSLYEELLNKYNDLINNSGDDVDSDDVDSVDDDTNSSQEEPSEVSIETNGEDDEYQTNP